jgi:cellulose synthase/poly-beta-1,6-N-acetylglucosamine synthase-like glycosyltransferase
MILLFWVSVALLAYIYAGYPALVWVLAGLFGREPQRADVTPAVSLLIPAYNEAAHIEAKLRNSVALDYPRDRLEIVVADDGSTDETLAIARRFQAEGVTVLTYPHIGKSAVLTRTVPSLRGEIVVFSDATIELEPGALRALLRAFADPAVGCVSGTYRLKPGGDLRAKGEGLYWRYESFVKRQESRLHSVMGAHGPCYAIRKAAFEPLRSAEINDDYLIPMRILARGRRVWYEPGAVAWEPELVSVDGEFARRRRIAAGNCQQTVTLLHLLNPLRGWVALTFASHKVLRTLAPLFMLTALVTSLWLPAGWRETALGAQALLYGSALAGYVCQRRGVQVRWLSLPLYFCLGNLAMLAGLWNYVVARKRLVWERVR